MDAIELCQVSRGLLKTVCAGITCAARVFDALRVQEFGDRHQNAIDIDMVKLSKKPDERLFVQPTNTTPEVRNMQPPATLFVCFCFDDSRRSKVPQTLLSSSVLRTSRFSFRFRDGQREREHAGTGAGRQEHAGSRRTGRLDQEPRSTRKDGRTQVSRNRSFVLVVPYNMREFSCLFRPLAFLPGGVPIIASARVSHAQWLHRSVAIIPGWRAYPIAVA